MSFSCPHVDPEKRNRIRVSLWAWAYEIHNHSLVPDHVYDEVAKLINPSITTGNDSLDRFFQTDFSPHTGMWVHRHPEKDKLERRYQELYANQR